MSEITIAQPLSGHEVIKAVTHEVERMLQQDCYLSPNAAYESFTAKIHIEIKATDCGRFPEVKQVVEVKSEEVVDDDAALVEADSLLYDRPPNEVRQESEQPIPTLVENSEGRKEIKNVKYAKKTTPRVEPDESI